MRLTKEQILAIIEDTSSKLEGAIEDIDCSDFEMYEDEYGHCYNHGSTTIDGELEEICMDGLPGVPEDDSDIYISASYECNCSYHDDYDPGDYWTPPSGGVELDSAEAYITDIDIDISVYNADTDEYDPIEVSKEDREYIIEQVNKKVAA